jgi:hypothetical protein
VSGGRPTDYTPELVAKAWEYANGGWEFVGDLVPSVAGLACEIGVRRETCYAWAKDENKEFSNILAKIAEQQERKLLNGGLAGDFNAPITKMMLTKHGYSDKIEQEIAGKDGTPLVVQWRNASD